jgi:hypothetical protein
MWKLIELVATQNTGFGPWPYNWDMPWFVMNQLFQKAS